MIGLYGGKKKCVEHHNLYCKCSVGHDERCYSGHEILHIVYSHSSCSYLVLQNGYWEQKAYYFDVLGRLNAAVLTSAVI